MILGRFWFLVSDEYDLLKNFYSAIIYWALVCQAKLEQVSESKN